ncbi:MAG: hypothetical protein IPN70_05040 [Candidatus Moraniibacteriota bacterium]|nr:MAG: hypothetical protein IPN70_05040 [Candidatus Moranbacteria bacterium]
MKRLLVVIFFVLFVSMTENAFSLQQFTAAGIVEVSSRNCEAQNNGWGNCVGQIRITPEGVILAILPLRVTFTGLVDTPPEEFGCTPIKETYEVAFHSDFNGWEEKNASWAKFFRPLMIVPTNYPAKGYFGMRVSCQEGTFHYMPFNMAYWAVTNVTGQPFSVDAQYLFTMGNYREPNVSIIDKNTNTVRMDFGTNKIYALSDKDGLMEPMDSEQLSSCGFQFWNPDFTYIQGSVKKLDDYTVVADIPNFPFGTYGFLVCKAGERDLYVAVDMWDFPLGTTFLGDSYTFFKP